MSNSPRVQPPRRFVVPHVFPLLLALAGCDPERPEPSVETCTVERQQGPGETCQACNQNMAADMQPCDVRLADTGLALRCKTAGKTSWTEVWCGAASPPNQR